MYQTSEGLRTLKGAEARMFAAALRQTLVWVQEFEPEEIDVAAFAKLSPGQKLYCLATVGEALLNPAAPAPRFDSAN